MIIDINMNDKEPAIEAQTKAVTYLLPLIMTDTRRDNRNRNIDQLSDINRIIINFGMAHRLDQELACLPRYSTIAKEYSKELEFRLITK